VAYLDERGGKLPTWIIAFDVMAFGAFAAGLAALILGVIGLLRPYRELSQSRRFSFQVFLSLAVLCRAGLRDVTAALRSGLFLFSSGLDEAAACSFFDDGFACGTRNAAPHPLQRTRCPRVLSGTVRIARQLSFGQRMVIAIGSLAARFSRGADRRSRSLIGGAGPALDRPRGAVGIKSEISAKSRLYADSRRRRARGGMRTSRPSTTSVVTTWFRNGCYRAGRTSGRA